MRMLIGLAALATLAAPVKAASYDPYTSFAVSGSTVSTGAFAYGAYAGGAMTPLDTPVQNCFGHADLSCLLTSGLSWLGAYKYTGPNAAWQPGTGIFRNDRLTLHPNDAAAVGLAFVAPVAGSYRFAGEFSVSDVYPSGVGIGARTATTEYLARTVLGGVGNVRSFDFTATLGAGEGLAFYVDADGNMNNDSTGLKLLVSSAVAGVPEPATWAMMLLGFGVIGAAARRRGARAVLS